MSTLESRFTSRLRTPTVTARVGLWLGITFGLCFATGLVSHFLQHPPFWFTWPTAPAGLYRWTQGVHVVAGTAAIPLLVAKLWTVFPRLFARPHLGSAGRVLVTVLERASILALVGSAVFLLLTGLFNTAQLYPWAFFFTTAHYAAAWVAVGAILVHVAVKLPVIRAALGVPVSAEVSREDGAVAPAGAVLPDTGPSRRAFLRTTWLAAGVAVVSVAGSTVPWLRSVSVLAVRTGEGPQGLPVNRSAAEAGVREAARDAGYRLVVAGPAGERDLTLDDLRTMAQTTAELPIACVEGWSAGATWTGVPVRDLVALVGGSPDSDVTLTSLEQGGLYGSSVLPARHARAATSLLALQVNGAELDLDHGYPCRLIAPSRPGVTQTKWVARVEVS